jgi:5-methylcytosine-specific restriction endonuclease McrA
MPMRAPFLCRCGRIVKPGAVCPCVAKATAERKARFDRTRPPARERGYDKEWERAARAFLAEPGHDLCAGCGAPATVVMHIISIRKRPDLRMQKSNWRPGCQRCNAKEAAEERRQERK